MRVALVIGIACAQTQDCIREAYGVSDAQTLGQKWLKPDRYDIVAKAPSGVPQDLRPAMLQAILAERCKLALGDLEKGLLRRCRRRS